MAFSASSASSSRTLTFEPIDAYCKDFSEVTQIVRNTRSSIYGNQDKFIETVGQSIDRNCEVLRDGSEIAGVIVYKKKPKDGSLELRFLSSKNPQESQSSRYEETLFERIRQVAKQRTASSIVASLNSQDSFFNFCRTHGFKVEDEGRKNSDGYFNCTVKFILSEITESRKDSQSEAAAPPIAKKGRYQYEKSAELTLTTISTPMEMYERERRFSQSSHQSSASSYSGSAIASKSSNHSCTLKAIYIDMIQRGEKTVEGRVNSQMFRKFNKGDTVTWFAGNKSVKTTITDVQKFNTFDEMVKRTGYQKLVPDVKSESEATSVYNTIPGYTEKAKQFGVVAFHLEVAPQADSDASASSSSYTAAYKRPNDDRRY